MSSVRKLSVDEDALAMPSESISSVAGIWAGHLPITTKVLQLFVRRAEVGAVNFSRTESELYVACGFWAAIKERRLLALLHFNSDKVLREARLAFAAIGAGQIAVSMDEAIVFCASVTSQNRRLQYLLRLEHSLSQTDDSVDRLIASFASACVTAHWQSERLANSRFTHIKPTPDFRRQTPS
jgi:hypothetical protein